MCVLLASPAMAGEAVFSASSPQHRVAVLELYTSQGCSSCPPAEHWLSKLKEAGVSSRELIPLAFHVTYWDYIGWKDRYGSERYDYRQREIAQFNKQRTIYTPQFVLAGSDYRTYDRFSSDVNRIIAQPSPLDISIKATANADVELSVELETNAMQEAAGRPVLFLALYENNLTSQVKAGENEGRLLKHDYVVRQFYGPFMLGQSATQSGKPEVVHQKVPLGANWMSRDLNLVAFAQNPVTGEVLQAVQLSLVGKNPG